LHLVAYVVGVGMDATAPTGLYINPRRRGRISPAGLSCCVSSWTRTSDNAIPIRLKCGPNYQNGRLALLQAKADGYDAPILLNAQGHVAEGTGATFFMVRKGRLVTPPVTADILESITRATLIEEICPNVLGLPVVEREIDRTELYVADEAFFCGSGYEITPIVSIDRFPLGDGEAFAARSQALTAARGEAGSGRGDEARAGSRGQALATTKAEAVARGVAHSRARAGDPRAGAHGNGLRPHRRHAPADRPGSGPGPQAGARAPAAPTRLARGGAEADRRGPPDVRRRLPHRAVRG